MLSSARPSAAERNAQALRTDHLHADLGQRAARGGLTAVLAQLTRIGVQLISMAILARLLSPRDFGLVAMAIALTSFVGIFTDLGLSAATVQRKDIDQTTVSALFYINVGTGLSLALVCAAGAPLAGWIFGDPRVVPIAIALGFSIPVSAAGTQHQALLQRGMRWAPLQWTPIIAQALGGALAILLAWQTGIGYWALVIQLWTAALISTGLVWWFCPWRPDPVPHLRGAGSALGFGLHLTGFNFVNYFHRQFDNVLVGWRWGAVDLGFYSRAYQLLTLPLALFSAPIASAVVPALSRLQDDPDRWRAAFLNAFGGVNLISAGIASLMIATSTPMVRIVFGSGWEPAAHVFALLSVSMFAATPMNAMGWIYMSLGQADRAFRWGLMVTPFYVGCFILALPFGISGVALFYSIAVIAALFPCLAYASRCAPVSVSDMLRRMYPAIAFAAVAICAAGVLPKSDSIVLGLLINAAMILGVFGGLALIGIRMYKPYLSLRHLFSDVARGLCLRRRGAIATD